MADVGLGLIALVAAAAAVWAGRFVSRRTGPGLVAAFIAGVVGIALEAVRILVAVAVFNALGSTSEGVPWLVTFKLFNMPIVPTVAFFGGWFGMAPGRALRATAGKERPS